MQFEPSKSELIHFTRKRKPPQQALHLDDGTIIKPLNSARFLGIWIDRKLNWTPHLQAVKKKLAT